MNRAERILRRALFSNLPSRTGPDGPASTSGRDRRKAQSARLGLPLRHLARILIRRLADRDERLRLVTAAKCHAEAKSIWLETRLREAEALSIRIRELPNNFGEQWALQIVLWPDMIERATFSTPSSFDVMLSLDQMAGQIAAEAADKIQRALYEHFSKRMGYTPVR